MQDDLTSNQSRAIAFLVAGKTIEQAAQLAGVNPSTVHRWLKDDLFAAEYRTARRQAVDQSITMLQGMSQQAAHTLIDVLTDKNAPASTRLRAAQAVLDVCQRWTELDDVQQRLAALEAALARQQSDGAYPFT
jgi:hypothetical protein